MEKEELKTCSGCLLAFIVAVLLFRGCDWFLSYQNKKSREAYIEKRHNDSIRKAFIKDSLAHDPRYQDSIRLEKARYEKWEKEEELIKHSEIGGFVIEGDSIYHTALHTINFINDHAHGIEISKLSKITFYTVSEIELLPYKLCTICEEMSDVYSKYSDNELIDRDNAKDYDLIPIDEVDEYYSLLHEE